MERTLRVALATSAALPELDVDEGHLRRALAARGIEHRCLVWDDPDARWEEADLVVIRCTWDYWRGPGRRDAFLAWAERTGARVPLWNEPGVLRENTHKSYLRALEAAGVPVVPTLWLPEGEAVGPLAERVFGDRGWSEVVIKPAVSACSVGALRVDVREDPTAAEEHAAKLVVEGEALVQPYLRSIEDEGELSVVFFGGEESHAVRKVPKPGDFRSQPEYDSRVEAAPIGDEARTIARAALAAVGRPLLYARVDLVRGDDGALRLIELELTEPSLYFGWAPHAADRFADVIAQYGEGVAARDACGSTL
jgi:glutathione synthase/RimK-type ligase-like ATP-grasp enzyme